MTTSTKRVQKHRKRSGWKRLDVMVRDKFLEQIKAFIAKLHEAKQ